jgi:hypothetical protein
MANIDYSLTRGVQQAVATNKVLKNTYLLLAATLGFSALMAMLSIALALPSWTYLAAVVVSMVLGIFVLPKTANSPPASASSSPSPACSGSGSARSCSACTWPCPTGRRRSRWPSAAPP